ncbi:MAG TPA: DoxX family protein [Noviherbaspirillum sp.]|nr:DoxX family protein [Noviherbaspirillum sp.]
MRNAVASSASDDLGKLVLRLALGILVLLHGVAKITGGVGHIAGMLEKLGMPGSIAYLVLVGEVLAPLLVIIGAWTRLGAVLIIGNMLVAIGLVHMGELLTLGKTGGWALELQGMFLFGAVAVALLGAGRYSLGGINGRLN